MGERAVGQWGAVAPMCDGSIACCRVRHPGDVAVGRELAVKCRARWRMSGGHVDAVADRVGTAALKTTKRTGSYTGSVDLEKSTAAAGHSSDQVHTDCTHALLRLRRALGCGTGQK